MREYEITSFDSSIHGRIRAVAHTGPRSLAPAPGTRVYALGDDEAVCKGFPCNMYPDLPRLDHTNVDTLGGPCPACGGTKLIYRRIS